MWKSLIMIGKWIARNPWVFTVAKQANEFVIKPAYEKYLKPIINKFKKKDHGN